MAALSAQTFTYDANDRISGDTFDANGNTLTSGGITYTYDFEDRLLTSSSGVTNVYDGDGNRISRTASGVTTKFLVDENNPTGWPQVAEELVSGSVVAQYTHGLMRISQNRSGTVHYYGYDDGGSVRQLLNTTGTITDTFAYDAFGNTITRTGSTVNPYQYRAEQFDSALNMYYLRARYYLSRTGRFLTADTQESQFHRDSWHELMMQRYSYSNADPTNLVDPSGHAPDQALTYGVSQSALKAFLDAIAVATLGYCIATEVVKDPKCRKQNSGKFQAQGKIFGKDPGTGVTASWSQPIPPTVSQGVTMLASMWVRLTPGQQRALGNAFKKAAEHIATLPPTGTTERTSFYNDGKRRVDVGKDANRVDLEVLFGEAFKLR